MISGKLMQNILVKGVSETVENEAKQQTGGFLGMLAARQLLVSLVIGKGVIRASEETNRTGEDF